MKKGEINDVENPSLENPHLETPNGELNSELIVANNSIITPNIITPNIITPNIITPNIITPNIITPNIITPNIITTPTWSSLSQDLIAQRSSNENSNENSGDLTDKTTDKTKDNSTLKRIKTTKKPTLNTLNKSKKKRKLNFDKQNVLNKVKGEFSEAMLCQLCFSHAPITPFGECGHGACNTCIRTMTFHRLKPILRIDVARSRQTDECFSVLDLHGRYVTKQQTHIYLECPTCRQIGIPLDTGIREYDWAGHLHVLDALVATMVTELNLEMCVKCGLKEAFTIRSLARHQKFKCQGPTVACPHGDCSGTHQLPPFLEKHQFNYLEWLNLCTKAYHEHAMVNCQHIVSCPVQCGALLPVFQLKNHWKTCHAESASKLLHSFWKINAGLFRHLLNGLSNYVPSQTNTNISLPLTSTPSTVGTGTAMLSSTSNAEIENTRNNSDATSNRNNNEDQNNVNNTMNNNNLPLNLMGVLETSDEPNINLGSSERNEEQDQFAQNMAHEDSESGANNTGDRLESSFLIITRRLHY
jgi:hypothetical protein